MTMYRAEAIRVLTRRADFLHSRVTNGGVVEAPNSGKPAAKLSFDASERAALRYAIEHLKNCVKVVGDE